MDKFCYKNYVFFAYTVFVELYYSVSIHSSLQNYVISLRNVHSCKRSDDFLGMQGFAKISP